MDQILTFCPAKNDQLDGLMHRGEHLSVVIMDMLNVAFNYQWGSSSPIIQVHTILVVSYYRKDGPIVLCTYPTRLFTSSTTSHNAALAGASLTSTIILPVFAPANSCARPSSALSNPPLTIVS
jgi:hypothetical protein